MKAAYGQANARIMARTFSEACRAMIAAGGDISWSQADEIRCPALVITGQHDFLATPVVVEELAGKIANARFLQAEGASHDVYGEGPEWLQDTLVSWLASVAAAT
jgi:valacyclovir hydrolase